MKTCILCKRDFSEDNFYKENRAKTGLRSECIPCFKARRSKYVQKKRNHEESLYNDDSFLSELKRCIKCNDFKERRSFSKSIQHKDFHSPYCKDCSKQIEKENRNKNILEWRERHRQQQRIWRQNNKSKVTISKRICKKRRRERCPIFRAKESLCARLRSALKGKDKSANTLKLLGCSINELKQHLESKFYGDMSWENYGSYWHIDHIRPCASFDLTIEENQKQCFHYLNLQPLTAKENLIKGSKF